jgi:hypothetical protein
MLDQLKNLNAKEFEGLFKNKIALYAKEYGCLPSEVQATIYTDKAEKKVKIALYCQSVFKKYLSLKDDILGIKKSDFLNTKHMIVSSVIQYIKNKTADKFKKENDDVSFVFSADSESETDFNVKISLYANDELLEENFSFEGIA